MLPVAVLFAIFMLSLKNKGVDRLAGCMFASMFIIQEAFGGPMSMFWYCASNALIALFIMRSLRKLEYSEIVEKIMALCAVAIVFNIAMWLLWEAELPVAAIDGCFIALYAYTAFIVSRGETDGEFLGLAWMRPVFYFDSR